MPGSQLSVGADGADVAPKEQGVCSTREYSFGRLTHAGKPVALPTTAVEGLGFLSDLSSGRIDRRIT